MDEHPGASMTPRGWITWGLVVLVGAVVLPLALRSTAVGVAVLALLAAAALVRLWLRRRDDGHSSPTASM